MPQWIDVPGDNERWQLVEGTELAQLVESRNASVSGSVTGTGTATLAAATGSATGATTVVGTSARTLAGDTSVASGTTTVIGAGAAALGNDTGNGTGNAGTPTQTGSPGGRQWQPITFGPPEPIDLYDERLVLVLALT